MHLGQRKQDESFLGADQLIPQVPATSQSLMESDALLPRPGKVDDRSLWFVFVYPLYCLGELLFHSNLTVEKRQWRARTQGCSLPLRASRAMYVVAVALTATAPVGRLQATTIRLSFFRSASCGFVSASGPLRLLKEGDMGSASP